MRLPNLKPELQRRFVTASLLKASVKQRLHTVIFLIGGLIISPFSLAQPPYIHGPVAYVGHGGMFGPDGQEITPTTRFIVDAQSVYLDQLLERAPSKKRHDYSARLKKLHTLKLSEADKVHADAEVISQLIGEVAPSNAAQLTTINAALRKRYGELMTKQSGRPEVTTEFAPSARLLKSLKAQGVGTSTAALVTSASGQAYVNQCRAEGVPIPPDWGSSQWQARGMLSTKFIIKGQEAAVYTFESTNPRGICIALPRFSANSGTSSTLGIICQGNDTSKACFWDNSGPIPLTGITPLVSSSFKGGAALVNGNGVCTDCHAGENPFIVHPGSPLDRGSILKPNKWVEPIVPAGWPQNPGPSTLLNGIALAPGDGSCLTCHNTSDKGFPAVSTDLPGYCGVILASAFSSTGTMPLGSPGNATYLKHVNALKLACGQPPAPPPHNKPVACTVFGDGYSNMSAPSEAIYFAGSETACIPDGTSRGLCRRWFGRCVSTSDNVAVNFKVFNDGDSNATPSSDAVYNRAPNIACIPDGTSTGNCRRWFGLPATADGRKVECYLFDDGLTNWIGPTDAIYYRAPGQVCMPDGSASGACRKWFGNCQVTNQQVPPPPVPQPPAPPLTPKQECLRDCKAERDSCMAEVGTPGGPRPQQCVASLRACTRNCPP